jgi:hypothetical protein
MLDFDLGRDTAAGIFRSSPRLAHSLHSSARLVSSSNMRFRLAVSVAAVLGLANQGLASLTVHSAAGQTINGALSLLVGICWRGVPRKAVSGLIAPGC